MLKYRQIFFHIKRKTRIDVYLSMAEHMEAHSNLTSAEYRLFMLLHNSVLLNPTVDYFEDASLATELDLSISSIKNARIGLRQKGYALLIKFKDESNEPCLRVIVGKDQVALYNLGIKAEITNAKAFNKMLEMFPVLDPNLSQADRDELVKGYNKYYLEHINEFK